MPLLSEDMPLFGDVLFCGNVLLFGEVPLFCDVPFGHAPSFGTNILGERHIIIIQYNHKRGTKLQLSLSKRINRHFMRYGEDIGLCLKSIAIAMF